METHTHYLLTQMDYFITNLRHHILSSLNISGSKVIFQCHLMSLCVQLFSVKVLIVSFTIPISTRGNCSGCSIFLCIQKVLGTWGQDAAMLYTVGIACNQHSYLQAQKTKVTKFHYLLSFLFPLLWPLSLCLCKLAIWELVNCHSLTVERGRNLCSILSSTTNLWSACPRIGMG